MKPALCLALASSAAVVSWPAHAKALANWVLSGAK